MLDVGDVERPKPTELGAMDESDAVNILAPWQTAEHMARTYEDTTQQARQLDNQHQHTLSNNNTKNLRAELGAENFAARTKAASCK